MKMKNLLLKFFTLTFIAILSTYCTSKKPDPKIALIADFAQTIGNAKTDLGFELISMVKGKDIISRDSLKVIHNLLKDEYDYGYNVDSLVSGMRKWYEEVGKKAEEANGGPTKGGIKYRMISKYYTDQDRILAKGYDCKYKIKNPMLNMTIQEVKSTFYFSPDESKVWASH